MDAIKAQLLKIQQQLSGLSASQRMLTASLVAIMVMTMIWWGKYAGTAEMAPVIDQSMLPEQSGRIKAVLDGQNIPARIVGDRVMVDADQKYQAFAVLAAAEALPSNSSSAWDDMIKQMSPWDSKSKTDLVQNHMREQMMSDVMTRFFPNVAKANVIINPVSERRIGGSMEPTASVQITTRGRDSNTKKLVESAASTVASAVPGLNRSRVSVVVDGIPRHVNDPNQNIGGGGDLYDTIQAQEKYAQEKIQGILTPNTLVAVTVDVEMVSSEETKTQYDAKNTLAKEKRIETTNEDNSQPTQQVAEPGALPNTGLQLGSNAAVSTATNTRETSKTDLEILPSKSEERLIKPGGKATVISAAVRLPRSYFVTKYKMNNGASSKEPDDAALQPLVSAELPLVRTLVQNCVAIKSPEGITVDMYYDGGLPMLMAPSDGMTSSGSSAAVTAMVGGHGKEIAIGALALISLFMISTIVKKGTPAPVIAQRVEPRETPRIGTIEDIAGVVGNEGPATLDGMELDEDAIRAQQMVEQVSTMVKEDPDGAANLVKRWLNRS